jgi:hypothetical protein
MAANTGSTPVSATKPLKIIYLQKGHTVVSSEPLRHRQGRGAIPDRIRLEYRETRAF